MKIENGNYSSDFRKSLYLLEKFRRKNNIPNDIEKIVFDMGIPYCGVYLTKRKIIKINPMNCDPIDECIDNFPGYTYDRTMHGIMIHEYSHHLIYQFRMLYEYTCIFKRRLILNFWGDINREEEMVTHIMLYLTNPFFLKYLDIDRYQYFETKFKSPIPCSEKSFIKIWNKFPAPVKKECKEKWDISVRNSKIVFWR